MVKKHIVKRFAFTLIELIFAIVIIGITVISLPTMTQVSSKNIENSLVQEAIFAASAELSQALSFYWDENSIETSNTLARVINLNFDNCDPITKLRPGHINQAKHRRCLDDNTTTSFNAAGGVITDLNDAEHTETSIYSAFTSDADGYKQDYNSSLSLTTPYLGSTEVKQVTVTITSNSKTITSISAFSCNLGEIDYYSRSY